MQKSKQVGKPLLTFRTSTLFLQLTNSSPCFISGGCQRPLIHQSVCAWTLADKLWWFLQATESVEPEDEEEEGDEKEEKIEQVDGAADDPSEKEVRSKCFLFCLRFHSVTPILSIFYPASQVKPTWSSFSSVILLIAALDVECCTQEDLYCKSNLSNLIGKQRCK